MKAHFPAETRKSRNYDALERRGLMRPTLDFGKQALISFISALRSMWSPTVQQYWEGLSIEARTAAVREANPTINEVWSPAQPGLLPELCMSFIARELSSELRRMAPIEPLDVEAAARAIFFSTVTFCERPGTDFPQHLLLTKAKKGEVYAFDIDEWYVVKDLKAWKASHLAGEVDGAVARKVMIRLKLLYQIYSTIVADLRDEMGLGPELDQLPQCSSCGAALKKRLTCSRCKMAFYCSADCQKVHWKVHKPVCVDWALLAAVYDRLPDQVTFQGRKAVLMDAFASKILFDELGQLSDAERTLWILASNMWNGELALLPKGAQKYLMEKK